MMQTLLDVLTTVAALYAAVLSTYILIRDINKDRQRRRLILDVTITQYWSPRETTEDPPYFRSLSGWRIYRRGEDSRRLVFAVRRNVPAIRAERERPTRTVDHVS